MLGPASHRAPRSSPARRWRRRLPDGPRTVQLGRADGVGALAVRLRALFGHSERRPTGSGFGGAVNGTEVQLGAQVHSSSWLRRDDAPSVMDSMESSSDLVDAHLTESAISASVASAASKPDVEAGPADAGWREWRLPRRRPARATCDRLVFLRLRLRVGVAVANKHRASRSALSTSTVLWIFGQFEVL